MRQLMLALVIGTLCFAARDAQAIDPYAGNDPYWVLLHEPAVLTELKLSSVQRQSLQMLTDELDLRYFPLRNQPHEVARTGAAEILTEAREKVNRSLQPAQQRRLNEILYYCLGHKALLDDDVATRLKYTDAQKQQIKEINRATRAATAALQRESSENDSDKSLETKLSDLQSEQRKKLVAVLKPEQRNALKTVFGPAFDVSKLRQPRFKAPELVDTGEWINSSPLRLQTLRGSVVVIHFYAFGCSNCIHNYPWYQEWHGRFKDQDVVMIGIHTPETETERNSDSVRLKATEEKFEFPIIIDGNKENWNAWGNSMWPSVYLIDKRGYLRDFWPGELKWQGNDGEKYMRERIEGLLSESGL